MKNRIFNQKTNQDMNQETIQEPIGKGVIFIKSRKSDDKIHNRVAIMRNHAEERDVEILDIIVDESCGLDVDRIAVDRLWDWIENSTVGIIFFNSIFDITCDKDDLDKFLSKAQYYGMILVDMEAQIVIIPDRDGADTI